MATDNVISLENLSKRYVIGHQTRHDTLRDALTHGVRRFGRLFGSGDRGLAAGREEFWALRDVSFEVRRGEVLGIIGRNGAGKSTLLKILSRITEPTGGRAAIRGRVASLLEVGTGFHPELTGRENIFLNGAILGMGRLEIRRKFDEIVAFAEVERFLDTPVKHYSSGMYVRLAFAVAAHLEPEILIVDEVLAVGDLAFQKKCLDRMQAISARELRTVIMVSHNLNSVLQLCTRVAYLAGGRLTGLGAPADLVRQYLGSDNPVTAVAVLADQPRPSYVRGYAKYLSGCLVAPRQLGPWRVQFGDAFRLELRVKVLKRMEFFEIGLSVFSLYGFEICSSLSSWTERLGPTDPGEYLVTINYPAVALVPSVYHLSFGLRSERGLEDHLTEAIDLEITESDHSAKENFSTIHGALAVEISTAIRRVTT